MRRPCLLYRDLLALQRRIVHHRVTERESTALRILSYGAFSEPVIRSSSVLSVPSVVDPSISARKY